MTEILRFQFPNAADRERVESDACLAIFSAECLHGRPKTRLEVSYLLEASGVRCVFEVRGEAGGTALQVFIGLCGERFGEAGFTVERVSNADGD